jgi:hypothetical protein
MPVTVIRWTHVGMQDRRHNGISLSYWYSLLSQGGYIINSSSSNSSMKGTRTHTRARKHTHKRHHDARGEINEAYRCQLKLYFVLHDVNEVQTTTRNSRMTGCFGEIWCSPIRTSRTPTAVPIDSKLRCHTSELTSVTDFHRETNNTAVHVKHADPRT